MSFWRTPLIQNLEQGQLPKMEVDVTIENSSLVKIGVVLVLSVSIILVVNAILKSQ